MYFLEVGLVLIVVPWSAVWDRNLFIESYPLVQAVLSNSFARGAVSGLGVLNLWAGLSDLAVLLGERRPADERTGEPRAAEVPRPAPEA